MSNVPTCVGGVIYLRRSAESLKNAPRSYLKRRYYTIPYPPFTQAPRPYRSATECAKAIRFDPHPERGKARTVTDPDELASLSSKPESTDAERPWGWNKW